MSDPFLEMFGWLTPLLNREQVGVFDAESPEQAVVDEFRKGWGKKDSVELLKGLSKKHGPIAAPAIEHIIASCITNDWVSKILKKWGKGIRV